MSYFCWFNRQSCICLIKPPSTSDVVSGSYLATNVFCNFSGVSEEMGKLPTIRTHVFLRHLLSTMQCDCLAKAFNRGVKCKKCTLGSQDIQQFVICISSSLNCQFCIGLHWIYETQMKVIFILKLVISKTNSHVCCVQAVFPLTSSIQILSLFNAVERSVHLHGLFTTSGGELYLIIHRC